MPGRSPEFINFTRGTRAYNTDYDNWAPSVGASWTFGGGTGVLGRIFGRQEGDSILRGGFTRAYSREGMNAFSGQFNGNPGVVITTPTRDANLGNLNDGQGLPVLYRQSARLGPAPFPTSQIYPITDVVTQDINLLDPNLQVPYADSWTVGLQRANAGRRTNASRAGIPANFFLANPDLQGGADLTSNVGRSNFHGLQIELRRRLAHGLQFQTSYALNNMQIDNGADYGDCGVRSLVVAGPLYQQHDITIAKRVNLVGRTNVEFRFEMLNAFNHANFLPVGGIGNNINNYEVTGLTGTNSARIIQLVSWINW